MKNTEPLIAIRKPTSRSEANFLLKMAYRMICDVNNALSKLEQTPVTNKDRHHNGDS